jgi:serralysin
VGDINGDGFADIVIGFPWGGTGAAGISDVLFGNASGFHDVFALNGSNGFQIVGAAAGDYSGASVGAAGDVNGDGFADLIVGARYAESASGSSYVVFGKASGFAPVLNLSTLDGSNGFKINGEAAYDYTSVVAPAGDVNGDGFDDVLVGAPNADANGVNSGAVYVVFGHSTGIIENNGNTTLAVSANHFQLLQNGNGPTLKFSGQDVVAGQFGDWTPIAAEHTGSGYEIAWKSFGSNLYSLWNTNANGNYIANIGGVVSGSDPTLLSAESFFHQDLNGDGQVAPAMASIETSGNTTLATSANRFYLLQNGSGPSLKFSGQDVIAGQFGDWTPLAAEQTASGYEIAWKSLGSNRYSLWNTDANGNYIANIGGAVSGSDPTLLSAESFFHQDLNGDGQVGLAMTSIESNGNTTLATSANRFYLLQNGSGPSLKFSGQDVVAGQFGDWTPLAAEHTALGYEIAWKSLGSNLYSVWNTDANGNYVANIGGAVPGSDPALLSAETFFHQDLNGDGLIS